MKKHSRSISAFPAFAPPAAEQSSVGEVAFPAGDQLLLSSGRAGVYHAVRALKDRAPFAVLVPAYHCGVEIEAVRRAGGLLRYYRVDKHMRACAEDIDASMSPEVGAALLIHYWGMPQDSSEIKRVCDANGVRVIEDCAHALFARVGEDSVGSAGDAAVFSIPKFLGAPDGGVLVLKRRSIDLTGIGGPRLMWPLRATLRLRLNGLQRAQDRRIANLAAWIVRKRRGGTDVGRGLGDYGETPLSRYWRGMSPFARRALDTADPAAIRQRRRRNYAQLVRRLVEDPRLDIPFANLPEGASPLFLPVALDRRDIFEAALLEMGVEPFVFGRNLHPTLDVERFGEAAWLSRNIIGLPVHQELDEEDIASLAERVDVALGRTMGRVEATVRTGSRSRERSV